MRICIIDLETKPDLATTALLPRTDTDYLRRLALHQIAGGSMLCVNYKGDEWSGWSLRSWATPDQEDNMIDAIEEEVLGFLDSDGEVVTFGGLHHDLQVLRLRSLRRWCFGSPLAPKRPPFRHRDLMVEYRAPGQGRPPALRDLCAGLGIELEPDRIPADQPALPSVVRKSQSDCVGTFLLYLFALSCDGGSAEPLLKGWPTLGKFLGGEDADPHLRSIAAHPCSRHFFL